MNAHFTTSRRYLVALTIAAIVILIAGVLLRPREAPVAIPSEADLQKIQSLTQRRSLDRMQLFYRSKASDLVGRAHQARSSAGSVPMRKAQPGDLLLLVAPDNPQEPTFAPTNVAGQVTTGCGNYALEEIETTATITRALSTAVAFDLDDMLIGFVVDCGDRRIVITPEDFEFLRRQSTGAPK